MHVLLIPPEEFVPDYAPLSGIFQHDQALSLAKKGVEIGVFSVTKPVALKPGIISLVRKIIGKKVFYKVLEGKSIFQIVSLLLKQLKKGEYIDYQRKNGLNLLRIQCRCWSDESAAGELNYFKHCIKKAAFAYIQKAGKPELIHAHNAWLAGLAAMQLSRVWKIPFGITEHSTFYARNLIPHSFYPELNKCYSASVFNLVVSHSLGELLKDQKLILENYRCLPNMLDPLFEQKYSTVNNQTDSFVFLTIGELTQKKAQDLLLRSFSKSFKEINSVHLIIGGAGDMDSGLKQIVIEEGISSQVTFTGQLDRKQVLEQMRHCNVFVLPSLYETFGVVLIEAMAMGKAVIATRSGGPETFVNNTNGLLISPGNADELSNAMEMIYRKEKEFDATAIRNDVLKHFGSEKIASSLIHIYTNAIT